MEIMSLLEYFGWIFFAGVPFQFRLRDGFGIKLYICSCSRTHFNFRCSFVAFNILYSHCRIVRLYSLVALVYHGIQIAFARVHGYIYNDEVILKYQITQYEKFINRR